MSIGPYQPGNKVRIPLEVLLNGKPIPVDNPRVQRLVLPDGSNAIGFPQIMTALKPGTYMYEFTVHIVGNYTAILQAEIGIDTIEQIEPFIVEKPWGFPRIEVSSNS
jgi:hypothetical protein